MSGRIHDKLVRMMLTNSLVALVLLSGLAFYGMFSALQTAKEMGEGLGRESYQNSSELLIRQRQQELEYIAESNAAIIGHRMLDIQRDLSGIARQVQEIRTNPQRFRPQNVAEPSADNYGELAFYLQYGPEFSLTEHQNEIAMTANIQDLLTRTVEANNMIGSCFVATRDNYTLSVDDNRQRKQVTVPKTIYDALRSDWYQGAASSREMFYSPIRQFVFSKELGLFCSLPYFDERGELAGVAAAQVSLARLGHILKDVELYNRGVCFVLDENGHVILSSAENADTELAIRMDQDVRQSANSELATVARSMAAGKSGVEEAMIDGEKYYVAYAPVEHMGWSFAAAIVAADVIAPVVQNDENIKAITTAKVTALEQRLLFTMLALLVLVLVLAGIVFYRGRKLSRDFVEPIQQLTGGVRQIAKGNLEIKLAVHTGDELEELASCFNNMTDALRNYMKNLTQITAEKERIATELSVATRIQESMLPQIFPPFPERQEFDIFATMRAAKEVGGDFYDFYMLDSNHVLITIADVSGKGVPAALFMVITKTILKDFALTMSGADDIAALVKCANEQLCRNNDAMMFATAFIGMLEVSTGKLCYVNAGHNPPVHYRKQEQRFQYLTVKPNFVLGGMEDFPYESQEIILQPGDRLFLYTDGVSEALSPEKELYGEERLLATLNQQGGNKTLPQLVAAVDSSVQTHAGGAEQSDDITMLVLGYHGLEGVHKMQLKAEVDNLAQVNEYVDSLLAKQEVSMQKRFQLDLAVEEIFVNIANYAYEDTGDVIVEGRVNEEKSWLELTFIDSGVPYNPLERDNPDVTLSLEERQSGGLGIFLAKKNVDSITYEYQAGCNRLTIGKKMW